MDLIRTAIVEDEESAYQRLSQYLDRFSKESGRAFSVTRFPDALAFLDGYQKTDLVFMDIQLPHISGMEGALRLRKIDEQAVLIFVTNMAQYAVKGYEADALDFIVKPVAYSDFSFKMKRALKALRYVEKKEAVIRTRDGIRRVAEDSIMYIEIRGHTLSYHLPGEIIAVRGRLSEAEEAFPAFLKCNNCYLVNPRHVDRVEGYEVTVGGDVLTISHPRRKAFMEALSRHYTQGGN